MLGFLKSNVAPIAIDFGYTAVKVLQVQPGAALELIGAALLPMPTEIRANQFERQEFLLEKLPKLILDGGFKGKVACCSIPAWQTFIQHLQLDKADGAELTEQVMAQLQMAIAIDPSQAVIRHSEVGDVFRDGKSAREVIAFAVSREVVMGQVELLKKCKLEVGGLHAEPIAVLQAYQHLYRRAGDENTTTLYLDIGYHGTQAVIAHGREMKFAKSIPVGGRHFDEEIARVCRCEIEDAFARRLREINARVSSPDGVTAGRHHAGTTPTAGGVVATAESGIRARSADGTAPTGAAEGRGTTLVGGHERREGSVPREFQRLEVGEVGEAGEAGGTGDSSGCACPGGSGAASAVRSAMSEVVLQFVDELRMCVRYHRAMFPARGIDRMILNGGESQDAEMCRQIASILGIKAFVGDPLKRVRLPVDVGARLLRLESLAGQPGWAVPMGLCLSPIER